MYYFVPSSPAAPAPSLSRVVVRSRRAEGRGSGDAKRTPRTTTDALVELMLLPMTAKMPARGGEEDYSRKILVVLHFAVVSVSWL